ncbi:MAG: hypothetical protein R3C20_15355 [Planctomycetaceae bacterium]
MRTISCLAILAVIVAIGQPAIGRADEPRPIDLNLILPIDVEESAKPDPIDINTYRNAAVSAYCQALRDGKYTLVLFSRNHRLNGFARRLAERIEDPVLAKYSDKVVFTLTDPYLDDGGRDLADAMKVNAYPTLVVLKTERDRIHVTGQMIGEHDLEQVDRFLRDSLKPAAETANKPEARK